ncbi:OsmC family protein [Bdellovibrio sp. SKB1291214]|uniref:OsmC family protein n=1 Tax=Bdellovibrio sp. SKB1291214 TaxID=1732569 RepID=UPI000B5194D3|nr:OsmC family protein [Bdellovibrio sp. SKB1291214]UYL07797.1 OsmC family protein [Bdellovibrio sp. SKB1291214]
MRAKVHRIDGHHFKFEVRGMQGDIDVAAPEVKAQGPSPKELILAALCGCTGTDIIDLMAKFKVTYESLELEARAGLTDKHPKIFNRIDLTYSVKGSEIDATQVVEAVKRSTHQYSGTAAMLSKAVPIFYTVQVNGETVATDQAQFA